MRALQKKYAEEYTDKKLLTNESILHKQYPDNRIIIDNNSGNSYDWQINIVTRDIETISGFEDFNTSGTLYLNSSDYFIDLDGPMDEIIEETTEALLGETTLWDNPNFFKIDFTKLNHDIGYDALQLLSFFRKEGYPTIVKEFLTLRPTQISSWLEEQPPEHILNWFVGKNNIKNILFKAWDETSFSSYIDDGILDLQLDQENDYPEAYIFIDLRTYLKDDIIKQCFDEEGNLSFRGNNKILAIMKDMDQKTFEHKIRVT